MNQMGAVSTLWPQQNSLGLRCQYNESRFNRNWRQALPAGAFRPNLLEIHDMNGNVYEWGGGSYDTDYYAVSPRSNPTGSETSAYRVFRGGCYASGPPDCRVVDRGRREQDFMCQGLGFRMAARPLYTSIRRGSGTRNQTGPESGSVLPLSSEQRNAFLTGDFVYYQLASVCSASSGISTEEVFSALYKKPNAFFFAPPSESHSLISSYWPPSLANST